MRHQPGSFVISLDFEIMWGVRDLVTIETYGEHLRGVHTAVPKMIDLFGEFGIKASFASVGLLFFNTKDEMMAHLPEVKPSYSNQIFSPYGEYLEAQVKKDQYADPYHFAPGIIRQLQQAGHEIATHTFSHYYCLESGQTTQQFEADLLAAMYVAATYGIAFKSIIFPRNQSNNRAAIEICKKHGITCYRGNEKAWFYKAIPFEQENLRRRFFRLADSYVNIAGHHCYSSEEMMEDEIINIPSSRFLRPYSHSLRWLEGLRLQRIKKSMTHAAKHNLTFHLWWHPHNFGINQDKNFEFLRQILDHFVVLQNKYGFNSETMASLAQKLLGTS